MGIYVYMCVVCFRIFSSFLLQISYKLQYKSRLYYAAVARVKVDNNLLIPRMNFCSMMLYSAFDGAAEVIRDWNATLLHVKLDREYTQITSLLFRDDG